MKPSWKNLIFYILILLIVVSMAAPLFNTGLHAKEISFSEFTDLVNAGKIQSLTIAGNDIKGKLSDGKEFKARVIITPNLLESLEKKKVNVKIEPPVESNWVWNLFIQLILPLLFFAGLWFLLIRQAQSANTQALAFGRSRARPLQSMPKATFKDVAGCDEAKEELQEIVEFLKTPQKFRDIGAKIPKGVLLMGAPGTGKTLLARAVAGEAEVPFFSLSGSDFVEMFVGVGASVAGDTPVLIKTENETRLMPISKFVDQYYPQDKEGYVIPIKNIKTLGFECAKSEYYNSDNKFFGKSEWKTAKGVFRHKVNKIYEIEFLGGAIKVTENHSIFVREKNKIVAKAAKNIKRGDKLVNLPFKVRGEDTKELGSLHFVRAHEFPKELSIELPIWLEDEFLKNNYEFVMANKEQESQSALGKMIGVSQATKHLPRALSSKQIKLALPEKIKVTPQFMKLLGFYAAAGHASGNLEFRFGAHETEIQKECTELIKEVFNLEPTLQYTEDNSLKIKCYSAPLAYFFERYCGNGSHTKHVPELIWDAPYEYFMAYLEGYSKGDGCFTKEGKLIITSVSIQLITELNWLCAMHGIKAGIRKGKNQGGRITKNKPLPAGEYYNLVIGKTGNPFIKDKINYPDQHKKAVVKNIKIKPYNGYVYDLCGCENEAFFGGEKPILLHNSRVRDLFNQAKKQSPCIIFMDEIDAVGRHRGAGLGGGHDEREQTLNQLLVEMDGFDPNVNIIVIAATNRPDILDPALLRPGRFDRQVILDKPDVKGREEILKIHAKNKPFTEDVKLGILARRTPGFTGADLENLCNEAAILAARRNKNKITMEELEEATDRVIAGPQKKSKVISEKEKEMVAYHEVGHALVAKLLPNTDPVHKISILPRGFALGYTLQLPLEDKYLVTKNEIIDQITVMLGGRSAEQIIFNEMTSGAHNDLERATEMAKKMVCEFGMSTLGPRTFGKKHGPIFLGRDLAESKDYGEKTAEEIDKEIKSIIDSCYQQARHLLEDNKEKLEILAKKLIEKETLEGEDLENLCKELGLEKSKNHSPKYFQKI